MACRRTGHDPAGQVSPWIVAAVLVGAVLAAGCGARDEPRKVAQADTLKQAWDAYKQRYVRPDGSSIDPSRNGETISEAQGYALLRAALLRDEPVFRSVWTWTDQHLKRDDGLFSWQWKNGRVIDANSASDANQEIALALIIASRVFDDPALVERARTILSAIRSHERIAIGNRWFPAAGNWAVSRRITNLSYFLPYAYPYFARVDPGGQWDSLVDTGYDIIARAIVRDRISLVPDFIAVSDDGQPAPLPAHSELSADSSSDAMRMYWRVAVDCTLHARVRACADPLRVSNLTTLLARDGALYTKYAVDGTPLERVESTSFYGAALPYLLQHAPEVAASVRATKLSAEQIQRLMSAPDRYYDANWVWFGLAAADGRLKEMMPDLKSF